MGLDAQIAIKPNGPVDLKQIQDRLGDPQIWWPQISNQDTWYWLDIPEGWLVFSTIERYPFGNWPEIKELLTYAKSLGEVYYQAEGRTLIPWSPEREKELDRMWKEYPDD